MKTWRILTLGLAVLFMTVTLGACNPPTEEIKKIKAADGKTAGTDPNAALLGMTPEATGTVPSTPATPTDVVASVDDAKLTRGQVDKDLMQRLPEIKKRVPADKMAQVTAMVRRQIIDDFIVRTLFSKEAKRLNIGATDQEIQDATEQVKATLPPGMTLEDMMKRNGLTKDKFRDEMIMVIQMNKLVAMQPKSKEKPSEKAIREFYKANKDKMQVPESVHARHILVAKAKGDDAAALAKKKAKADDLRRQMLAGGNFAELAKANSDCPSKANGGDLGTFTRGQMVKPFEKAAFGQKKNAIGEVVETDFGYHIIQVLDHTAARTQPLDATTRARIGTMLSQQYRYEAFNGLVNTLKTKAKIFVAEPLG